MKIIKHLKLLALPAICAAVFLASGCATDNNGSTANNNPPPKKDDRTISDRLKVGMTKEEVRQALGNPKGTTVTSQGSETWQYNDNEKVWIPF